jgi:hypothetical protein
MGKMRVYEVGKHFIKGAITPGTHFNYQNGRLVLELYLDQLTASNIQAIETGKCEFALTIVEDVIFLLSRFGTMLPWFDSPYSIHLLEEGDRIVPPILESEEMAELTIFLVSSEDGVLRAIRRIHLGHTFSVMLFDAIRVQLDMPFNREAYDNRITTLYGLYSSNDLAQMSIIRCIVDARTTKRAKHIPHKDSDKPLIEKYLTYLRIAHEEALARIKRRTLSHDLYDFNLAMARLTSQIYTNMAEKAVKYELARSGQNMTEVLRPRPLMKEDMGLRHLMDIANEKYSLDPDIPTPILHIPDTPIWITLEQPIEINTGLITGLFFCCPDREFEDMLKQKQTAVMQQVIKEAIKYPDEDYRWSLSFIDSDGVPHSHYQYYEQAQKWEIIPDRQFVPCPTDKCTSYEESHKERRYQHICPCPYCSAILAYWRSWFVTALLVVGREFAANEEEAWPEKTENYRRKVKRPGSGKYDEVPVTHTYHYVSFDACIKRAYPPQDHKPVSRGSWVADAQQIDPESVIYIRRNFGKSDRLLDPERNPRWKTKRVVPVKAHEKCVPMRVESVQKYIYHVFASKYE